MLRMIRHRLLAAIPLLFAMSIFVFLLQSLIPGNAAEVLSTNDSTPAQLAHLERVMHLNAPVYTQYWDWLDNVFHGSLGHSLLNGQPVFQILDQRIWVTLSLVGGATILATLLGLGFGLLSSVGGPLVAKISDLVCIAGMAIPGFWLALLLIQEFSTNLHVLPANGYVTFGTSPNQWFQSLVLPVVALGLAGMTGIAKQTREGMLDVSSQPFIRNLRANGASASSIVLKHSLRNVAVRIVTMMGLLFVGLLSGAVVVEVIFSLPGLGSLAIQATTTHDIPVIQGVAMYFTLLVVGANLIADLLYGWIDPRVRTL